jgi:hypothetical protein
MGLKLVGDIALLKDVSQSNYRGHSLARKELEVKL